MDSNDTLTTQDTGPAAKSAIDLLLHRASALRLSEPGPSRDQIECILQASVTAADHGRLRPWRFVVMHGNGRTRLGDLMAEVERAINPDCSEEQLAKARGKALRAPLVIALACDADSANKVPVLEQQFAVAAAGAHLMLAAKALGFGSNWKTGAAARHPILSGGLGLGSETTIVGLFYIGTEPQPSPLPRASIDSVVQYWDA